MLNRKGFVDVNKMANRVQEIFSMPLQVAKVQRIIFLVMRDLSQFNDEQILEFVKRER